MLKDNPTTTPATVKVNTGARLIFQSPDYPDTYAVIKMISPKIGLFLELEDARPVNFAGSIELSRHVWFKTPVENVKSLTGNYWLAEIGQAVSRD